MGKKYIKFKASEEFVTRWDYLAARSGMTRDEVLVAAFDLLEKLIIFDEQGKEFIAVDKNTTT